MNIKLLLKQVSLGLLIVSANGATKSKINCENFKSSNPDITVVKCVENNKGKITKLNFDGLITANLTQSLNTLTSLEELQFYHTSYNTDFDLSPLKNLKKLKSLVAQCFRHGKHKSVGSIIEPHSFDGLKSLEKLEIDACDLSGENDFIGLTSLKELSITITRAAKNIPDLTYLKDNENLNSVTFVNVYSPSRRVLETNFSEFKNLKHLEFTNFAFDQSDIDGISSLETLEELILKNAGVKDLNLDSFRNLKNLKSLVLEVENNEEFPEYVLGLTNLTFLQLSGFDFEVIPEKFTDLKNLETISLTGGSIKSLPESFGDLTNLEYLYLGSNSIEVLPESLKELKNLKELYLTFNNFKQLPDLSGLSKLEILDLDSTPINVIPEYLPKLKNLKSFSISPRSRAHQVTEESGYINEIPEFLKDMNLEYLAITLENIREIPDFIGEMTSLKILDLSHNFITEIPESFKNLKNLEELDLSYNDLKELPEFLNTLNLKRVDFIYNENLTGKTLTNESLVYCGYHDTKLCISNEEMECIISNLSTKNNLVTCKSLVDNCGEIQSILESNNIDMEFECDVDENNDVKFVLFDESVINEEALDKILSYSTINEINITYDGSKNVLEKIANKLPDLESILISVKAQTINLAPLKNLKKLDYLNISGEEDSNEVYTLKKGSLKYLTGLKDLSFFDLDISQNDFNEMKKLTNLEDLFFRSCKFNSNLDFSFLKKLQNLQRFVIEERTEGTTPLNEIPSAIYSITNLKELTIYGHNISRISSKISNLKNLEYLDLSQNAITSLPSALNKMESLTYVDFQDNPKLKGKTLTNEHLEFCHYDSTSSICKAKEMPCFDKNDEEIPLC